MLDLEFCKQILGIQAPWQVLSVTIDQPAKRLDIHIGFTGAIKRSVFGFTLKKGGLGLGGQPSCPYCHTIIPKNGDYKTVRVRHLPLAGFATYLHVPEPGTVRSSKSDCVCMQSWVANGTSCTNAMHDYLVAMLRSVSNADTILQLTGITPDELREFNSIAKSKPTEVAGKEEVPSGPEHRGEPNVPDLEQPIWRSLIKGNRSLQSGNVALNMLLQRARMNYDKSPDVETVMAGATRLRQFFLRNQSLLKQEMDQLCNRSTGDGVAAGSRKNRTNQNDSAINSVEVSNIPGLDHPNWQLLIKGDMTIQSNAVAFNMLLQRVRMSYAKSPGVETTVAGAKILQQFFVRNQKVLKQEIGQLNNLQAGTRTEIGNEKVSVD